MPGSIRIVPIVEGHGEVDALPVLLRRLASVHDVHFDVAPPIRCSRDKIIRRKKGKYCVVQTELVRALELAAGKCGDDGVILFLNDADDACPAEIGPIILKESKNCWKKVFVVLAKYEYEAWFLASMESLRGKHDIRPDATTPADPENIRGAKEHITEQMEGTRSYSETTDQPALSALFDFEQAMRCKSFAKFRREIGKIAKLAA